jgi:hypothetical protein
MPIETATFLQDLNSAYPSHTDGLAQADSHLRLIKTVLDNTFPNLTAAVTGTPTQLNAAAASFAGNVVTVQAGATAHDGGHVSLSGQGSDAAVDLANAAGGLTVKSGATATFTVDTVGNASAAASVNAPSVRKSGAELLPYGVICMWAGAVATVPAGWHLCDGTAGTPDLRNRFVVGAGNSYGVGATGGATTAAAATDTQGWHSHAGATGAAGDHTHSTWTDAQGSHSHGGSDGAHTLTINEVPWHDHGGFNGVGVCTYPGSGVGGGGGNITTGTFQGQGGGLAHAHSISADGSHAHNIGMNGPGNHTHSIGGDGNHAHNVTVSTMSPYYALAYIMKL